MSKITTILASLALMVGLVPITGMSEVAAAALPEDQGFLLSPVGGILMITEGMKIEEDNFRIIAGWYNNGYGLKLSRVIFALPAYDVGLTREQLREKAQHLGEDDIDKSWMLGYAEQTYPGTDEQAYNSLIQLQYNTETASDLAPGEQSLMELSVMDTIFYAVEMTVPGQPDLGSYWERGEFDYRHCIHHTHRDEVETLVCGYGIVGIAEDGRRYTTFSLQGYALNDEDFVAAGTWEDELKKVALDRVAGEYAELVRLETEVAEGRKVTEEEIEARRGAVTEMAAVYTKLAATELLEEEMEDYQVRVEALAQANQTLSEQTTPSTTVTKPTEVNGGSILAVVSDNVANEDGGAGAGDEVTIVNNAIEVGNGAVQVEPTQAGTRVEDVESEITQTSETEANSEGEKLEVPALGATEESWLSQNLWVLLVAGVGGVALLGWWVVLALRRRQEERVRD